MQIHDLLAQLQSTAAILLVEANKLTAIAARFTATQETRDQVLAMVSSLWGVTPSEILGTSQARVYSTPRHVAMAIIYELTGASYAKIAALMCRDSHCTVGHAIQVCADLSATDRLFQERYQQARAAFGL